MMNRRVWWTSRAQSCLIASALRWPSRSRRAHSFQRRESKSEHISSHQLPQVLYVYCYVSRLCRLLQVWTVGLTKLVRAQSISPPTKNQKENRGEKRRKCWRPGSNGYRRRVRKRSLRRNMQEILIVQSIRQQEGALSQELLHSHDLVFLFACWPYATCPGRDVRLSLLVFECSCTHVYSFIMHVSM